jgi:hypothetical protein
MFATFFIYGPNQQPTWYTGEMSEDANGVWSGPLIRSTGSYFGGVWNEGQTTRTQVGTVTFTPSSSFTGTLTYNVNAVFVTKQITRNTFTTIPLAAPMGARLHFQQLRRSTNVDIRLRDGHGDAGHRGCDTDLATATPRRFAGNMCRTASFTAFRRRICGTMPAATGPGTRSGDRARDRRVAPVGAGCIESGFLSAVLL